jgi:xylan 1,4-beta-xylosidase
VSHWRIDDAHSNSHEIWRALGAPQDPSDRDLHAIQARQELERLEPDQTATVRDGTLTLRIALPLPSVSLLEIRPAAS